VIDLAVVLVYLAGTLLLGLRIARKNRGASLDEYSLGGRRIPVWAVLGSILAAEVSAATFLGAPAEGYKSGNFFYCQLALGTILGRVLVSRAFLGLYYRHEVKSIYEFLQIRFGPSSKNAASLIFLVSRILGTGVRLYLGGVIFGVISRAYFHEEPTLLPYCAGILTLLALTTLYTVSGGIKAVIYTDVLQFVLMVAGALAALVTLDLGLPPGAIHEQLPEGLKFFQLGSLSPSEPYTLVTALFGMTFLTLATHGTDQDMVQRMLTAKSVRESRLSLVLSGLVDLPIALIFSGIGILLFVHYRVHPDALAPAQPNEIFAHYIVTALPAGVRGLVLAGLFATLMGSTSAALNSLSVSLTRDWIQPYFAPAAGDRELTRYARVATAAAALGVGGVALAAAYLSRASSALTVIPLALGLMGLTYGSLLGIFLLGALTKDRGADRMNVLAMACGIAMVGWLSGTVAWPWYTAIGCATTASFAALFRSRRPAW
jgi:SSS family transporter